jgi:hypothetical protein
VRRNVWNAAEPPTRGATFLSSDSRSARKVAPALGVFDADQNDRPHRTVAHGHLQKTGDVQKIFRHAAVGHVEHGPSRVQPLRRTAEGCTH